MKKDDTTILLDHWWRNRDRDAVGQLFLQNEAFIVKWVKIYRSPVLTAKLETNDLVNNALIEFLQSSPRFQVDSRPAFRGFMKRIIRNTVADEYRWWRRERRDIARENPLPPDTCLDLGSAARRSTRLTASEHEREAWIRTGLEFLRPDDQRIIVLRTFRALPFAEVARQIDATEDAARMRFKRAQDRLGKVVRKLRRGQLAAPNPTEEE